jgi:Ni,Fe-hydrogenase maturation factor
VLDCPDAVLVIAWGDPLREDDGVGWHVLEAVVLSIAGERFGTGESLSPVVRRAIPRAIRAVIRQAKAWTPVGVETAPSA